MVTSSDSLLTKTQQKSAAKILGAAFSQDPFMTYVFPDTTSRVQNLTNLFLPIIRCSLRCGGVEISPEGGALAWLSGECLPLRLSQLTRSGLIWTPLLMGLPAFRRLQGHDSVCEHELKKRAPDGFAYLWLVGVHPTAKGRGLGSKMIRSTLGAMQRQGYTACLLRTDNEKNVPFYKHLDFKQIYTDTVPSSQLRYWLLSQNLTQQA